MHERFHDLIRKVIALLILLSPKIHSNDFSSEDDLIRIISEIISFNLNVTVVEVIKMVFHVLILYGDFREKILSLKVRLIEIFKQDKTACAVLIVIRYRALVRRNTSN